MKKINNEIKKEKKVEEKIKNIEKEIEVKSEEVEVVDSGLEIKLEDSMFEGKKIIAIIGEKKVGNNTFKTVKCDDGANYDILAS